MLCAYLMMSLLFADATKLRILGEVPTSFIMTAEDLATLPRTTWTESGGTRWEKIYEGVSLRDLLIHAGVSTSEFQKAESRKTVRVTNSYGAWTYFYLVELDSLPVALLAFRVNGQPFAGNTFMLIATEPGNILAMSSEVVCIEVSYNARSSWHN